MSLMRARALWCASSLLVAIPSFPQALAPLTEKIEVSVTNVDVTVTDRRGHPVTGLTRDDFEIFEDGKPQKVTNFYAIENAAVRADPVAGGDSLTGERFRRKIVLVVDNNFTQIPPRNAALDQLDRFIDQEFDGGYEWSVIAVGHAAHIVQTFTADKQRIHAALDQVRHMSTDVFQPEQDRTLLSDDVRRSTMVDPELGDQGYQASIGFRAREQTIRTLHATTNTARAVIQTCRAFSGAEGKKIVILVTGGMERNTTFAAYDVGDDKLLQDLKLEVGQTLDEMVREANAANFNLYVIKTRGRGMVAPQHDVSNKSSGIVLQSTNIFQQGGGAGPIDTTDVDSASLTLALGTGGLYLTSADTNQSLETIDSDTANYYSLGYSPKHGDDGEYHLITVKVKKRGLVVRYREGYMNASFEQRLDQSLMAPLTFQRPRGSLPVTLEVGTPVETPKRMIPITAAMPMSGVTVLPRGDEYVGRVHVYLSVFDQKGNNVGYHHLIKDLTIPKADQPRLAKAEFRYRMNVALEKGDFTVVVTLRDDVSNELGTVLQKIQL